MRLSLLFSLVFSLGFVGACGASLPSVIQEEMARAPRGTATVVFFTDFQCPYCRRTHEALAPVVAEREGKVRVVLRHVPLRSHPDARDAARAAICVEQIAPRSEADFVHALFTTQDLSPQACEQLAVDRGVDRARYRTCVDDAATDMRIERDTEMYEAAGGDGVPLLFVGRARLDGQQSRAALAGAIDDALGSH